MTFLKYRETRVYPISPANHSFYNIVERHPKRRKEKKRKVHKRGKSQAMGRRQHKVSDRHVNAWGAKESTICTVWVVNPLCKFSFCSTESNFKSKLTHNIHCALLVKWDIRRAKYFCLLVSSQVQSKKESFTKYCKK